MGKASTLELPDGILCDLLSLPDLVLAKKTQRDKDWPMIRRLMEAHYFGNRDAANPDQVRFWLREMRTPSLLIDIARNSPSAARETLPDRPLLAHALEGNDDALEAALRNEEEVERLRDRDYWLPLKHELERLRRSR